MKKAIVIVSIGCMRSRIGPRPIVSPHMIHRSLRNVWMRSCIIAVVVVVVAVVVVVESGIDVVFSTVGTMMMVMRTIGMRVATIVDTTIGRYLGG